MELVGDEKKIQALFSELRSDDQRIIPRFRTVLARAESRAIQSRKGFSFSFVAATAFLICALVSVAWWSSRWQSGRQSAAIVVIEQAKTSAEPAHTLKSMERTEVAAVESQNRSPRRCSLNFLSRRRAALAAARMKATSDAIAIASWKSPTADLLVSPSDEVLTSLPKLNQSANELKSFLTSRAN